MSLVSDVLGMLDARKMGEIAGALGESDHSVSQGMQSAVGAVLGGMASKSNNPDLLQRLLSMGTGAGGVSAPSPSSGIADPRSTLMSTGSQILSTLFGDAQGRVTQALGSGIGLQPGTATSLLAMAAPLVMNFLRKRTTEEGMSMTGLGNLLQQEAPAIRSALPAGLSNLLGPDLRAAAGGVIPAVAQAAVPESRGKPLGKWLLPALLLVLIPTIWLLNRQHNATTETPEESTGTANRTIPDTPIPRGSLPGNLDLHFQQGSMKLQPAEEAQLKDFAAAVATTQDAHVSVNAYTDNVGSEASNMRRSQERANAVKADLIRFGVPADRIDAEGFGERNPIADNDTAGGRAANNRVSVGISNH